MKSALVINFNFNACLTSSKPFMQLLAQSVFNLLGIIRSPEECKGKDNKSRKSMASCI